MLTYPLMFGFWEIFLIVLALVLLFGAKKIPELMQGVGKGVKSFKDGLNGVEEQVNLSGDDKKTDDKGAGVSQKKD